MKKQRQTTNNTKNVTLFAVSLLILLAIAGFTAWTVLTPKGAASGALPSLTEDGFQDVRMSVNGLDYEPSTIAIRSGQKVRWTIDGSRAQGCARTMYSKELGINQLLSNGNTVIEFTPTRTGTIAFSCTMGMARGEFQVV